MKLLSNDIVHFFQKQGFVIVSTVDGDGYPHTSCKGIVHIEPEGKIYLLDLYRGRTHANLKRNARVSITAVDEHKFKGYCLKGTAQLVSEDRIKSHLIKSWEEKVTSRLTRRVLKEVRGEAEYSKYPELLLPKPEYMVVMTVEEVIDLAPRALT